MPEQQGEYDYCRPFSQEDYYMAEVAYGNMVGLKIISEAEAARLLRVLKAAVRD